MAKGFFPWQNYTLKTKLKELSVYDERKLSKEIYKRKYEANKENSVHQYL